MTPHITHYLHIALGVVLGLGLVIGIAPDADAAPLTCFGQEVTHQGTPGNDIIDGTEGDDVISGLGGDDIINGLGGDDIICAGTGADFVYGNDGNDFIFGGLGHDVLHGSAGNDRIWAGIGNDWVYGGKGSDDMTHGMAGSDVCIAETEWGCEMDYRGKRDVEEWRDLVDKYFGATGETDFALVVMECESEGDPFAVGGSASRPLGLFQHIEREWDRRARLAGFEGATAFHPEANIAAAEWLVHAPGGGWSHWTCP